jgi:acyl transferase domain-containing protein
MDPMLDAFDAAAASVTLHPPDRDFVSNVSGALVQPGELSSPRYWRDHARSPVRFLPCTLAA